MKLTTVLIGLMSISLFYVGAQHANTFDVIKGCRQYNTELDYNDPLRYFPTAKLVNVVDTGFSKYFRIGVLGPSYGVIRYGASVNPYGRNVVEIVLDDWDTSTGRLQLRLSQYDYVNKDLNVVDTPQLLSPFRPVMMLMKVSRNGQVYVFLEGQNIPFLTFLDPSQTPANFFAFTKYYSDLIFFFDCPMRDPKLFEFNMLNNTTA